MGVLSIARKTTLSMAEATAPSLRPRAIVFDLDGCVWSPEMYQLWGGGAPFKPSKGGDLVDTRGEQVVLMAQVREIMAELKTSPQWEDTVVAVASCCDEPAWARECLDKFTVGDGIALSDIVQIQEIYKGSKSKHLRAIATKVGCELEEIVFFDNEGGNCRTVAGVGCTVGYTPAGVTRAAWTKTLAAYPSPGEIIGK